MIVFKKASNLMEHLMEQKIKGKRIGFVPTMGALHQGHLSLIRQSKLTSNITVVSIFVNPTQFNDASDFERYPVTIAEDIFLLEGTDCDILFLPAVSEIYTEGVSKSSKYIIGEIENVLEGAYRPGHFQGVCQVVDRLLTITHPDSLILGEKDYQQQIILKNLVHMLHPGVEVLTGATVREPSGLARSSRNMRLDHEQKKQATAIFKSMQYIKSNFHAGGFANLEANATQYLLQQGFTQVDYVTIADANTLQKAHRWNGLHHLVVLVAATIGNIRLIDNLVLTKV